MKERLEFLRVYLNLNDWLKSFGFECYKGYNIGPSDMYHKEYKKYNNPLHGVEYYINEDLNVGLKFMRDSDTHKINIVFFDEMKDVSIGYTIKEFKEIVKNYLIHLKKTKIDKLNAIDYV